MKFDPLSPSLFQVLQAIEKQTAWHKDIAKSLSNGLLNNTAFDIVQKADLAQKLSASAANNIALFAGPNSLPGMALYLEQHKTDYTGYLSVSSDIANVLARSLPKPIPALNALTMGISGILGKISYQGVDKQFTAWDAIMGSSFMNFSKAMEGITHSEYESALIVLKENEDVQRVIQETLSTESVESIETEEGYQNLESILGEKLYALSGINKFIIAILLFLVLQMLVTVIKKETERAVYGDSTKKIITVINQTAEQTMSHTDSLLNTLEQKKPVDIPFTLYAKHDCNVFNRNSIHGKVLHNLKKGDSVIAIKEFRKWDEVEIKIDSKVIMGFVLKYDLQEK